jgi:uncharacterized protein
MSDIIEQDFPYDISRRGHKDEQRHNRRVHEAVKKNLKDVISQQDIVTSEGNKKVRVKVKSLSKYRFRHDIHNMDIVGRDQYDELDEEEVIYRPQPGEGKSKAGEDTGEEIYEAEYTIDELTDLLIEQLKLPNLDEKKKTEIVSDSLEWTDRRKKHGIQFLVDKKQTLKANIMRRAKLKQTKSLPLIDEDMRFRTWNVIKQKHSNAVVFLMMDRSGSMWQDKIYAVKALYFWIVRFLRRKYDKVEIKMIAHDAAAKEMSEKEFFTISESGGTKVSSAYELCRDMIKYNYPQDTWNIYCFHASDGDTWGDEQYCLSLIRDIVKLGASLFAYAEINIDSWRDGDSEFKSLLEKEASDMDKLICFSIENMDDVLEALNTFLLNSSRQQLATV